MVAVTGRVGERHLVVAAVRVRPRDSTRLAPRGRFGTMFARALAVLLALPTAASADRRDWTGSTACGACHRAEFAAWQATPHATTQRRFAGARPEARCLACHATGEAPAGPAIAIEVGCEACHGAGA